MYYLSLSFFALFFVHVQVRKWIIDWNLNTEKKHTLLRLVYEALVDCKKRSVIIKIIFVYFRHHF